MQRRFGVMVGAAALGFAGMLGVGPSAAAAETAHMGSQTGAFWVYEHDDFKGRSTAFTSTDSDLRNNSWIGDDGGNNVNDNISSMKNQTDREVLMCDGVGCTGEFYRAKPHSEDKDLTKNANNPTFDNRASCVRFN
jgi:Peptidase inhibitor family I36